MRPGPLSQIPSLLAELGVDAVALLAGCGLRADALADAKNPLPLASLGQLLAACAAATGNPAFGLLVGERADWSDFGAAGEMFRHAPVLGEALAELATRDACEDEGALFYLSQGIETSSLCFAALRPGRPQWAPLLAETALASLCRAARALTGVRPIEVHFARRPPEDAAAYERYFGAPVVFDAVRAALIYAGADLAAPVAGAEPAARAALALRRAQGGPAPASGVVAQTRRAMVPLIHAGAVTLAAVAGQLALQPRTLNRRLVEQGTSFQAEVDRLRYALARQLLANTDLPVTQICSAFGYSALSAFSRSFRRWSGLTPSQWRETEAGRDPARIEA